MSTDPIAINGRCRLLPYSHVLLVILGSAPSVLLPATSIMILVITKLYMLITGADGTMVTSSGDLTIQYLKELSKFTSSKVSRITSSYPGF